MDSSDNSPETPPSTGSALSQEANNNDRPKKSSKKKASSSRKETIVLMFVIVFILNSINGQKLIKSVNDQIEGWQTTYYSQSTTATAQDGQQPENKTEETAVIITSSWIPSHPSTYMVDMVLNSTERLIGLSPTAPIFITIDHFRYTNFANLPPDLKERINTLEEYTVNLLNQHLTNPRIHIIPAVKNLHIGGSVVKALNLIERHYPTVRYVYYLQHDFYFTKDVDHTALVNVMNDHPDKINYVRFPKRQPWDISRSCGDEKPIKYNRTVAHVDVSTDGSNNGTAEDGAGQLSAASTMTLSPTSSYSDNNHLVRFSWYKEVIPSIIKLDRAPEDPLQVRANAGCASKKSMGLYLYHEMNIGHLDGRRTPKVP